MRSWKQPVNARSWRRVYYHVSDCPQVYVNVERDKSWPSVNLSDVYKLFSLSWAVRLLIISTVSAGSGKSTFKRKAIPNASGNLGQFYVRNSSGNMVPLSAVTSIQHRQVLNSRCI